MRTNLHRQLIPEYRWSPTVGHVGALHYNGGSARRKKCRQQEGMLPDEDFTSSVLSQAEIRRETKKKRLEIEDKCVNFESARMEKETENFEDVQSATNRGMDLDERSFELDRENRRQ